jgi:hypothetical protein
MKPPSGGFCVFRNLAIPKGPDIKSLKAVIGHTALLARQP